MKASELRVGNKTSNGIVVNIFEDHFFTKVDDTAYNSKYHPAEPIPLTEEWLLKFGFIQIHENNWQDVECEIMVDLFNEKIYIISAMPWKQLNHIKYVHQLQNLYFVLTGEELTLNQNL